jgi:hypothetical protein
MPLVGDRQGPVQRLFQIAGEGRHWLQPLIFSMMHCRVLMLAGVIHDLRNLRLGDFVVKTRIRRPHVDAHEALCALPLPDPY